MVEEKIEQGPLSPTIGAFESLQSQSKSMRRSRPPNIIIGDENKVPLRLDSRAEKISKRESKIGLRSIFGRTKPAKDKDGKDLEGSTSPREPYSRSGGIRASLADLSNWPHSVQASRSDLTLSSPPPSSSRSTSSFGLQNQPSISRLRQHNGGSSKPLPTVVSPTTGSWAPSPLFQVYPQAIKHATLPACTASVDTLLRLSGTRNSLLLREESAGDEAGEKKEEKSKKLHVRNGGSRSILDWTTKTYVLVTSGYLLQYGAEGPFDRLPEKILRLSKDSAAFASDLIPGRHWVIQIASSLDANGTPAAESRSFISKLALRGLEKKHVSTFLMVLDSAEEMDSWLAVLRREIEELGGRKQLTETGEIKKDDTLGQLKTKPSQRTIVVRDPERFSTMIQQDFSWSNDNALKQRDHGLPEIPISELAPDFPMDDNSTTESHYSSDGQHLDSLRDSNNRLSYNSSGQRTYVTSANSSPACSPIRASFSSHPGDSKTGTSAHEYYPEVRLRPNAQAISSRRQSMQTVITGFDVRIDPDSRRHSATSTATDNSESHHTPTRQSVPNFSKRFSGVNPVAVECMSEQISVPMQAPAPLPAPEAESPAKTSRKSPPTALVMSRPLSTVMDMPTPRSPLSPYSLRSIDAAQDDNVAAPTQNPSLVLSTASEDEPKPQHPHEILVPADPRTTADEMTHVRQSSNPKTIPRRFVSMTSLRAPTESSTETATDAPRFILSSSVATRKAQFESASGSSKESPRSFSSMGSHKRSSFMTGNSSYRQKRHSFAYAEDSLHTKPNKLTLSPDHTASFESQHSGQYLNVDLQAKSLIGRKSMPHLAEGPPLAPPPNRALPPIPKRS